MRELTAALRDAAVGRSGADALAATARAYRAYAPPIPGSTRPAWPRRRADDAEHRAAAAEAIDVIFAVLRGWQLEGDDAVHAVRAFRSAVHGFVALEAAGGFGIPVDLDDLLRAPRRDARRRPGYRSMTSRSPRRRASASATTRRWQWAGSASRHSSAVGGAPGSSAASASSSSPAAASRWRRKPSVASASRPAR